MKRTLLVSLAMAMVGCWLCGCLTRVTSVPIVVQLSSREPEVRSRQLGRWIEICDAAKAQRGNVLEGQVIVRNLKTRDCQVDYRFQWLDKDGMELTTIMSTWEQHSLGGKSDARLKATAPDATAVDFVCEVRFRHTSVRWGRGE